MPMHLDIYLVTNRRQELFAVETESWREWSDDDARGRGPLMVAGGSFCPKKGTFPKRFQTSRVKKRQAKFCFAAARGHAVKA